MRKPNTRFALICRPSPAVGLLKLSMTTPYVVTRCGASRHAHSGDTSQRWQRARAAAARQWQCRVARKHRAEGVALVTPASSSPAPADNTATIWHRGGSRCPNRRQTAAICSDRRSRKLNRNRCICRDFAGGRDILVHDWKSWCPRFESGSRHSQRGAVYEPRRSHWTPLLFAHEGAQLRATLAH
jgi:hypothetical protein